MSDFNKLEWMLDNMVVEGNDWVQMPRKPASEFCEVRLKDGRETGPCWPRAIDFVDLSSDDDSAYPFSQVTHVRYYISTPDAEDDSDDGDDEDDEDEDHEILSPVEDWS